MRYVVVTIDCGQLHKDSEVLGPFEDKEEAAEFGDELDSDYKIFPLLDSNI